MKDAVRTPAGILEKRLIGDASINKCHRRHIQQVPDILNPARKQIVKDHHLIAATGKGLRDMGADESCTSRHNKPHVVTSSYE